jgi:hypothetical protein
MSGAMVLFYCKPNANWLTAPGAISESLAIIFFEPLCCRVERGHASQHISTNNFIFQIMDINANPTQQYDLVKSLVIFNKIIINKIKKE